MEVIKTKKEKFDYKAIPTGKFYEIETYKTEDGQEFTDKRTAINHEYNLYEKTIERVDIDISEFGWQWYRAKNEKELVFLKQWCHSANNGVVGIDNIQVGEWFCHRYEDGGDSRSVDYFYTLRDFKQEYEDVLKKLTEWKVDFIKDQYDD